MRRTLALPLGVVATALALAACSDSPVQPTSSRTPAGPRFAVTAADVFANYVALGTSNSQGVQSAGLNAWGQSHAWPAQLASRAGVPLSLPLVADPGCNPPLQPPLAYDAALLGAFSAFGAGDDLMNAVSNTCAPLQSGIVSPTNGLAVSGADVHDALYSSYASELAVGARVAPLYQRVLGGGTTTQVSAMLAKHPTLVSVELAANDVLPASTGRIAAMTPYDVWQSGYDSVLTAVRSTGARAVLVGLPNDAAKFPSIRTSREFFNQWSYMLTLGVTVSYKCYYSSNYLFIPGYVLTLLSKSPTTATCADVPGAADYVITPSDMTAINAQMARMNTHIRDQAAASGYAYFALSALYDLPKPSLNMYNVLFSSTPFGPNMSLDGVHPSVAGQTILANAAVQAVNAAYGLAIP
jgi:hypothetical protein